MGWEGLSSYMCLDHMVRAGDFNVTEVYGEILDEWSSVHCDDVLYPALAVLPMGFPWSLFFCPGILTEAMLEGEARRQKTTRDVFRCRFLKDRQPASHLSKHSPILAPYVDNADLLCWGRCQGLAALASLMEVLDEHGLKYREEFETVLSLESVGLVLDGPTREI